MDSDDVHDDDGDVGGPDKPAGTRPFHLVHLDRVERRSRGAKEPLGKICTLFISFPEERSPLLHVRPYDFRILEKLAGAGESAARARTLTCFALSPLRRFPRIRETVDGRSIDLESSSTRDHARLLIPADRPPRAREIRRAAPPSLQHLDS
ncbi:hypothetical protein KM043_013952 [Ampulex compressa]|nr:hypothetical protein KM043_013952 [Ampulex compressa]